MPYISCPVCDDSVSSGAIKSHFIKQNHIRDISLIMDPENLKSIKEACIPIIYRKEDPSNPKDTEKDFAICLICYKFIHVCVSKMYTVSTFVRDHSSSPCRDGWNDNIANILEHSEKHAIPAHFIERAASLLKAAFGDD